MKTFKKIATLLLALALLLAPFASNKMTAEAAATPTTFYCKYVDSIGEWRFIRGGAWTDNEPHSHMYYLGDTIKDGDIIVVDNGFNQPLQIDVNVKVSNVTLLHGNAVITAKSIDNFYALQGSYAAVNGDVTNAYVYDSSICNFNNNVKNLNVVSTVNTLYSTVGVVGTVEHFKAYEDSTKHVYRELYNFAANSFAMNAGTLTTAATSFSTAPAASSTTPSADDYDEVPKTGEWNPTWLLLAVASVCFVASRRLRKA